MAPTAQQIRDGWSNINFRTQDETQSQSQSEGFVLPVGPVPKRAPSIISISSSPICPSQVSHTSVESESSRRMKAEIKQEIQARADFEQEMKEKGVTLPEDSGSDSDPEQYTCV